MRSRLARTFSWVVVLIGPPAPCCWRGAGCAPRHILRVAVTAVTVVSVEFTRCRWGCGTLGAMPSAAAARRESPVARQIFVLQVLVVLVARARRHRPRDPDARRDTRDAARDEACRWGSRWPTPPPCGRPCAPPTPARRCSRSPRRCGPTPASTSSSSWRLDRERYTHPDPSLIGQRFVGDLGDAPRGGVFTQEYAGTLGRSIRSVVPVRDDGRVVALVSVGTTLSRVDEQLRRDLPGIALSGLGALAVGLAGAWLISRRLRRQTHGLGEREITRMYEYYRAVLAAVREGLVLVDTAGRVQLVNDEARRLLRPARRRRRAVARRPRAPARHGRGGGRRHRRAGPRSTSWASTCC